MKYIYWLLFLILFEKNYGSPFAVDQGGTGISQAIVSRVLSGGTTNEGPLQFVSGTGTSGQGLVSAGSAPLVWQNVYPGYIAGTNFMYAGSTTTLAQSPSRSVLLKPSSYGSITSTAVDNTLFGHNALTLLQSSMIRNTMVGARNFATSSVTAGSSNTAVGTSNAETLATNISSNNTMIGVANLRNASSSSTQITLIGNSNCLAATAGRTVAVGYHALFSFASSATTQTALGCESLNSKTSGSTDVAMGYRAMFAATTGNGSAGTGANALLASTGSTSTAIGSSAGSTATTGSLNIYIGYNATPISATENNNIVIGNSSSATAYFFGIYGVTTVAAATNVLINSSSQLGTIVSSKRYKKSIVAVPDETVAKLLNLEVLQFNYIADETKELNYGMIAQDVVHIFPETVVYDLNGEIYSIQYHKFIPLVVKQVQQQHEKIQNLTKRLNELMTKVVALQSEKG